MIRIVLAEDHNLFRSGLRALLDKEEDIEIIGEAKDGRSAVKCVRSSSPDIVIMDIGMPNLNGIEATRQIKQQFPETRILMLSMYKSKEHIFQSLEAGASGYLLKVSAYDELVTAIRQVAKNRFFLSADISKDILTDYVHKARGSYLTGPYSDLSAREKEVFQLIVEGKTNKEIGKILFITAKTAENHKCNIMKKLKIKHVPGLVKLAIDLGIIETDKAGF